VPNICSSLQVSQTAIKSISAKNQAVCAMIHNTQADARL